MSQQSKWLAYLLGAHGLFLFSVLALYRQQPWLVLLLEALLVFSLALGLHLRRQIRQPLEYARRFGDLLQDRNYAARLHIERGDELAELVELFNGMLDALYQERIKLGEQRGFLDRLLAATPSAVVVFDFDGRISLLNPSASALLGIVEAEDRRLADWLQGKAAFADELDEVGRRRGLGLIEQLERLPVGDSQLLQDPDGRRFRAQRSQFFDRGFARDFLLIEELTAELESSERATYEKLVRVLAHEVNNTVAATGSVLESLLYYSDQLHDADRLDFGTAVEAIRRRNASLGEFIERFTRVVKMPDAQPQPTDLAVLVEGVARLYRESCRQRGIALDWRRCDPVGALAVDGNLMEPALLNIIKNAIEAVESRSAQHDKAPANAYVHLELVQETNRIRLSIIDSGDCLGDVPAGQMFTPFFSTKKGGQGIGLLFVREVLHRHRLSYRLDARDRETRFDIWLPMAAHG